ncbi:RrF2 family transcriptional regulator [Bryobacter aggregatus]|uniref:RrF2 family transcriptional regulator n=1 Tax=Bryobacter aggregatus TaxID=360054 RepID=UPI0009B5AA6C|nr:Rrf2 family transcriptional regulator [Bryobacter aggregatus]
MLKLTKKADYSLIALRHLAMCEHLSEANPNPVAHRSASAKEISETYHIPLPILSKVLQKLGKTGFLTSVQGTNGGYKLARDANQMSVLEVIRAVDGPVILTACFTHDRCDQSGSCTVKEPLRKVHESILKLLESISIEALTKDDPMPEGGGNPPPGARNPIPGSGSILNILPS